MQRSQCALLLRRLEQQLRDDGLWAEVMPSAERLASTLPFAVDTLSIEEWLQFIFLPRMRALLDSGQPLPQGAGLAAYAEVAYREDLAARALLLAVLRDFDALLAKPQLH